MWEVTSRAAAWLERLGLARPLAQALPLLQVVVLMVASVPWAKGGLELVERHKEAARSQGIYPADPIYPWFRDEIASPSVVLASDLYSARIPSYSSEANVVSRRGRLVLRVLPKLEKRAACQIAVPQGSLDVREFFNGTDLETGVEILRRHQVDYLMVRSNSELDKKIDGLPGFEPVGESSERHDVYEVDLPTLGRLVDTAGNARLPPE
jgi:hypothetical protein